MDKENLTINQRLELAGIKTIRGEDGDVNNVFLEYNGKRIPRPFVQNVEEKCLEAFGIEI